MYDFMLLAFRQKHLQKADIKNTEKTSKSPELASAVLLSSKAC